MRLSCFTFLIVFSLLACAKSANNGFADIEEGTEIIQEDSTHTMNIPTGTLNLNIDSQAVVEAVTFSGNENEYRFNVQLKSPDTGCDQYADWWEIIDQNENLIYRRILLHSHVNEQPFTRSGSPVEISADTFVYIRGHMNNLGYGSMVFGGSINDGFEAMELPIEFGANLVATAPLPDGCAF